MAIEPSDIELYEKAKSIVYNQYKTHSAYRSGALVKKYKQLYEETHDDDAPYKGDKTPNKGLKRWFREQWKGDDGKVGYSFKSSVYRPTVRITKETPKTFSELTPAQLKKAKRTKALKGRVTQF